MNEITKESDLSDTSRSIHIVTTASLPWLTGTAVNPLLRAIYFQKSRTQGANVTLVIPWVVKESERKQVYPHHVFPQGKEGRKQHEDLVRDWIRDKAGAKEEAIALKIQFYPSTYQKKLGSILPLVDICSLIHTEEADVCILEEPEHLTWFSMPSYLHGNVKPDTFLPNNDIGWMAKFNHVVGIIHTNYPAYARAGVMRGSRTIASRTIHALSKLVCRSYCHKIVKLSNTLPVLAEYKECVCNVHGVREDFIVREGDLEPVKIGIDGEDEENGEIYFIGKILWAKGFDFLLQCEEKYKESTGEYFPIDVYGGGPEEEQVKRAFFGVRKKKDGDGNVIEKTYSRKDSSGSDDSDDKSVEEEEAQNESKSETDGKGKRSLDRLSEMMLKTMPFLKDELKKEDEATETKETSSTLQTLKDGFSLVKNFQAETLLDKIPKNKYEMRKNPIPARFLGPTDHAALKFSSYKVFVNPSITEVLCTTSAEALAMGKFVVLPKHPSNEFFYQFPNCLVYETMDEFVEKMKFAIANKPRPLSEEVARIFTWEAAMGRLVESAAITNEDMKKLEVEGRIQRDKRKAWIHKESGKMIKGDVRKSIFGETEQEDLSEYEVGGNTSTEGGFLLNGDNTRPTMLAILSFIIAILSYFAQR